MVKKDKKAYLEYLLLINEEDIRKEIERICDEAKLEKHYTIFIDTGGVNYVLEKIAADIYLSESKINEDVRFKLYILDKIYTKRQDKGIGNIYSLKKQYIRETSTYYKEKLLNEIEELKKQIIGEFI